MKRRIIALVIWGLCIVFLFNSLAIAENNEESQDNLSTVISLLKELSIDDLLVLQNEIQKTLADKGYVQYEELDRGSKGNAVSDVQERLKELGFYTGSINGKYDTETQKAFKQFEKNNGLVSDGKATQDDLLVLFGSAAVARSTPTPVPEKNAKEKKQNETPEGYLPFSDFDYTEYFRYPEKYYGTKIVLRGKVVQVIGSRKNGYQLRLDTSGSGDIVYIRLHSDPGFNILENDRITVYAVMRNTYTYTSTFSVSVTIPSADADSIILN